MRGCVDKLGVSEGLLARLRVIFDAQVPIAFPCLVLVDEPGLDLMFSAKNVDARAVETPPLLSRYQVRHHFLPIHL